MYNITQIEYQKKNKDRNDKFAFGIHLEIKERFKLEVGKEVDKERIEEIVKNEEQNKANNYALNLLSFRSRTEKEVSGKMIEKGYEEEIIDNAIGFLMKYNFINDKVFTESFVKDKSSLQKVGYNRIKSELLKKGVDKETISEIIDKYIDKDIEYENAFVLA